MKRLLFLFVIVLFGCKKYESEVLFLKSESQENTDGVVVFIKDKKLYYVSDLGQNEAEIPNSYNATKQVSLNYTKNKVAFYNVDLELVIINIDGTNKETLTQFDEVIDFEWSQTEDVLFILEEDANKIKKYGNTNTFISPFFPSNINVLKFTVSKDNMLAYTAKLKNTPYTDMLHVNLGNTNIYSEVFNNNDVYDFESIKYSSENKLYMVYNNNNSWYDVYFDPSSEMFFDHNTYQGYHTMWENNIKDTYSIELKNIREKDTEPYVSYFIYNIYNFREDGTKQKVTSFDFKKEPVIFDWKK